MSTVLLTSGHFHKSPDSARAAFTQVKMTTHTEQPYESNQQIPRKRGFEETESDYHAQFNSKRFVSFS
jgi:hypothetical protein